MFERKSVTREDLAVAIRTAEVKSQMEAERLGAVPAPDGPLPDWYRAYASDVFDTLPATPPASEDYPQHRAQHVVECRECSYEGPANVPSPVSETVDAALVAYDGPSPPAAWGRVRAALAIVGYTENQRAETEAAIRAEIGADANSKIAAAYQRARAESDKRVAALREALEAAIDAWVTEFGPPSYPRTSPAWIVDARAALDAAPEDANKP